MMRLAAAAVDVRSLKDASFAALARMAAASARLAVMAARSAVAFACAMSLLALVLAPASSGRSFAAAVACSATSLAIFAASMAIAASLMASSMDASMLDLIPLKVAAAAPPNAICAASIDFGPFFVGLAVAVCELLRTLPFSDVDTACSGRGTTKSAP